MTTNANEKKLIVTKAADLRVGDTFWLGCGDSGSQWATVMGEPQAGWNGVLVPIGDGKKSFHAGVDAVVTCLASTSARL